MTQYLESQQEDWRYYDMVWVTDLDAPEDHCKVFVDGSVERVSCDFLLPTICEMDEHVALSVDFLKLEFVYAIVAALVGVLLILVVCCLWCSKSRQRKKERFVRRESIRMSKSSLAGSRSLASMTSTSFTDINYRRRPVVMSPNGGGTMNSKTGTINSRNGTYKSATRTGSRDGSFDSLADKNYVMNSTVEEDLRSSFDMYDPHSTLGSHLAAGTNNSFTDTHAHEVHYAPGGGYAPNMQHSATIHSTTSGGYDIQSSHSYDFSRQPMSSVTSGQPSGASNPPDWNRTSLASSQMGPPGYNSKNNLNNLGGLAPTTAADSVLELKRELAAKDASPTTTSTSESGSSGGGSDRGREEDVNHEYQTMDRPVYDGGAASTFRPQNNPLHGRQLPQVPQDRDRIPSVPGYAKPYARPFDAPPSPPPSPPSSSSAGSRKPSGRPLETNFDEPANGPSRSRSMGQILETNFDDPDPITNANADGGNNGNLASSSGHSRSLEGPRLAKLSVAPTLLETNM